MSIAFVTSKVSLCRRRVWSARRQVLTSAQSLITVSALMSATTQRAQANHGRSLRDLIFMCTAFPVRKRRVSGALGPTKSSSIHPRLCSSALPHSLESTCSSKWAMSEHKSIGISAMTQTNRRWMSLSSNSSPRPSRNFAAHLRACGADMKKLVALLKGVVDTADVRGREARELQGHTKEAKWSASGEGFNMSPQGALTAAMLTLSRPPYRNPRGAGELFDTLLAHGLMPDTVCCNVALNALKQSKQAQRALALYRIMGHDEDQSAKWGLEGFAKPDTVSLNTTISACAAAGLWRDALAVLADVLESSRRNMLHNRNDKSSSSSSNSNNISRRNSSRSTRGQKGSVVPDLVSFNAAIAACGQAGAWTEACHVLCVDMPRAAVIPDVVTFNAAMHACCKAGEWQQALSLLEELQATAAGPERPMVSSAASVEVGSRTSRSPNQRGHGSSGTSSRSSRSTGSRSDGSNSSPKPSSGSSLAMTEVTFALALEACAQGGCWQRALSILASARHLFEASNSSHKHSTATSEPLARIATDRKAPRKTSKPERSKGPLMTTQGYSACLRNAIEACARGGQPTKVLELVAELQALTPAVVTLPPAMTHRVISSFGAMGDANGVLNELKRCILVAEQEQKPVLQHQKAPPQQHSSDSKISVNTVNVALRSLAHLGDLKQLKREAARELKLRQPNLLHKTVSSADQRNGKSSTNNKKVVLDDVIEWDSDDIDEEIDMEEEDNDSKISQNQRTIANGSSEVAYDTLTTSVSLSSEIEGWRLALMILESLGGQSGVWGGLDGIVSSIDTHSNVVESRSWLAERDLPDLSHVQPNAASYEAVVLGCCAANRWREAAALLQSMVDDSQHAMLVTNAPPVAASRPHGGRKESHGQGLQNSSLRPTERSVAAVVEACDRAGERKFAAKVREK